MRENIWDRLKGLILPLSFMVGFLLGILWITMDGGKAVAGIWLAQPDFLIKIEEMTVDKRALFLLCLGKSFRPFFLLWLLSYTILSKAAATFFFLQGGFCAGAAMELLIIGYGLKGLLFYLGMALPQGFFYGLGFLILGFLAFQEGKKRRKAVTAALFFLLIGCALEALLQPELLQLLAGMILH